jgi:hypothetical protein
MAKPPPKNEDGDDPRITDLRRYRKEREQQAAKKRKPNPKAQMRQTILGTNPRAGLIMAIVVVLILDFAVLPPLMSLIR